MNIRQFEQYFKDAWKSIDDTLKGQKHSNIELMGDSAAQLAINQMQTEAQQKESELAYNRSSASNQVNLMRQAGMSRAGAINALNGGGSYTPAPVSLGTPNVGTAASNISQKNLDIANAVIGGVSSLASNVQQFQQLKTQHKQFNESLSLQRQQLERDTELKREQMQSNERIAQLQADTTNRNADNALEHSRNMLEWEKTKYDKLPEYEKERYQLALQLLSTQKDMETWRLNDLKYRVLEYQSQEYKSTRDAQNLLQGIASDMDYHLSEKEMREFRDAYMYFDLETKEWKYKPATNSDAGNWLYENAPRFWDFAARILPANKLGDVISRAIHSK